MIENECIRRKSTNDDDDDDDGKMWRLNSRDAGERTSLSAF